MKLKTTLSSDTKLHHWGVGYGGTTGMGNGPTNPYTIQIIVGTYLITGDQLDGEDQY